MTPGITPGITTPGIYDARHHIFECMRRILFCILASLLPAALALAQFDHVYRTAQGYHGRTDTLRLRVWLPATDNLNRPMIMWVHGGAFYAGNYRDLDSTCKRWSERGYVAVTVQYRLGFYSPIPVDPPFVYDRAEIVRACWRGVQDVREALRFMMERARQYGIDTSCIALAGESAGSIIALQTAICDGADSVPRETGKIGDVQRGFDRFPRPDLGPIDAANARPLPTISTLVNFYGALMHPYMLEVAQFPAIFGYHQTGDLVVACGVNRALWGLPLDVGANWPVLTGTCTLEDLLSGGGHDPSRRVTMIHEGFGHELHAPKLIDSLAAAFVDRHKCGRTTSVDEKAKGRKGERLICGGRSGTRIIDMTANSK